MHKKTISLAVLALLSGTMAFANTPLLYNTDFPGYPADSAFSFSTDLRGWTNPDGWIVGANRFGPNMAWIEFVEAPDAFAYTDRVTQSGAGWNFSSWDDNIADAIESYLFMQWPAGPATGGSPSIFETGEVIVFKGKASAVNSGATAIKAQIKVLGYNDQGWENQNKTEYTQVYNVTSTLSDFELRFTFPDLAVDDSLQWIQLGFEVDGEFANNSFGTATIYFENIEAYIEGTEVTWAGWPVGELGWVDTGSFMGFLNVAAGDWVWSASLSTWIYLPEDSVASGGAWAYVLNATPTPAN